MVAIALAFQSCIYTYVGNIKGMKTEVAVMMLLKFRRKAETIT